MPRGDKSRYTDKQKRQAKHIEASYEERGVAEDEAESRAWATVNKMSGGGKKSGSGRAKPLDTRSAHEGAPKGEAVADTHEKRSVAAKKAAETRKQHRENAS
ncbi:MAG TPA: hypothetical protein PKK78_20480 [Kouleothrix sp.]|nr:hypothetical protein [Kouleothrix sp.]